MRSTIPIPDAEALNWAFLEGEEHFLFRRMADRDRSVLGVGRHEKPDAPLFNAEGRVDDWTFGALRYEWKDALEPDIRSKLPPTKEEHCTWFVPRIVLEWNEGLVQMHAIRGEEKEALEWASHFFKPSTVHGDGPTLDWTEQWTRHDYLQRVHELLAHIHRGDIYEVNFCTSRTTTSDHFDPYAGFNRLLQRSAAPFAGFYRDGDAFALCASPERFLAFEGDHVIGQPMKGTRPRSPDPAEDRRLALELAADTKERSENIMALDVMRNDLSRVAASGTVRVEELCAVIGLPKVHQMISTVSAELRSGCTALDAIASSFPMASMTGAPKISAMQLIENAECAPRGLFSGSLGFLAPDGTGDFNVVIRTMMFNARTGQASIHTGSAITALCDPEKEWEECQLKARSVIEAIGHA